MPSWLLPIQDYFWKFRLLFLFLSIWEMHAQSQQQKQQNKVLECFYSVIIICWEQVFVDWFYSMIYVVVYMAICWLSMDAKSKTYECEICSYSTLLCENLLQHKQMHKDGNILQCGVCEYIACNKQELQNHIKKHTDENPFSCNKCDFRTDLRHLLMTHMEKHEEPFVCDICNFKSQRKDSFNRHRKKHQSRFQCKFCDYQCSLRHFLKEHIHTEHLNSFRFSCNVCSFVTSKKSNFKRHLITHSTEKNLKCEFCGFLASRKSTLTSHLKKHRWEYVYVVICTYLKLRRYVPKRYANEEQMGQSIQETILHHIPWNFLKADFHKIYLVHSWILCLK